MMSRAARLLCALGGLRSHHINLAERFATMSMVLAVRTLEFQALVRRVPFLALPREEIDRLYAAIEVLAIDDASPGRTAELSQLHSYVAVHHNYSWLTFRRPDDQRTLVLSAAMTADRDVPLFLGGEMVGVAQRQVEVRLNLHAGYEVRLAGILQELEAGLPVPGVGLLSIARLASRTEAERCGHWELRQTRSKFDSVSQVVIDHLEAL